MSKDRVSLAQLKFTSRKGLTLIELMVTLSISSLLVSLILPAVQSIRKSARDSECRNHLRQLALASHNYQDQFGVFPTGSRPMTQLLPSVEQVAMFRDLSSVPSLDVAIYLCPAEAFQVVGSGRTSYLVNEGCAFQKHQFPAGYNGATKWLPSGKQGTRPSEFVDGLSQTAMWSERKLVPAIGTFSQSDAARDATRYLWYISATHPGPTGYDAFVSDCLIGRTGVMPGLLLTEYDFHRTDYGYNHVVIPNRPGCYNASTAAELYVRDHAEHAVTATSFHSGHVNCALADASVRSVNDQINAAIWSAVGTRNGREAANLE